MQHVRPPAVAGLFYPAEATLLRQQVQALLQAAPPATGPAPKALIAPHAGYVYSGAIAASAYAQLAPIAQRIRTVVLLGPAHRVALRGLALPAATHFATPLGIIELDSEAVARLRGLPQVSVSDAAHAAEHSLEVHLPFLQSMLPKFLLVPLVVGQASAAEVSQVLDRLWGGEDTLIVISSDLSHYLGYDDACASDRATADAVLDLRPALVPQQACGAYPINGLLESAPRHGLRGTLLDLRNSGDTAGDRARVVGYGAFAFTAAPSAAADADALATDLAAQGAVLPAIARDAIARRLGANSSPIAEPALLRRPGASFVTLMRDGRLRGCIGSLEARRPLGEDVRANACSAAFSDPRFPPLTLEELNGLEVEVSVLSAPRAMAAIDEADAIARLRPGVDGVVLQLGAQRATFLPQVWEQIPEPAAFLRALKQKAGLPADMWSPQLQLSRYEVTKFVEPAPT